MATGRINQVTIVFFLLFLYGKKNPHITKKEAKKEFFFFFIQRNPKKTHSLSLSLEFLHLKKQQQKKTRFFLFTILVFRSCQKHKKRKHSQKSIAIKNKNKLSYDLFFLGFHWYLVPRCSYHNKTKKRKENSVVFFFCNQPEK